MGKSQLPGAIVIRNIEILPPVHLAYKKLSSVVLLPQWDKVMDYLNDDTPITTTFLVAPYQEKCCTYGKLYEGRRLDSIIIKPVIVNFVLELKIGERYSNGSYQVNSLYIKNIRESDRDKSFDILDFLVKADIDFAILE